MRTAAYVLWFTATVTACTPVSEPGKPLLESDCRFAADGCKRAPEPKPSESDSGLDPARMDADAGARPTAQSNVDQRAPVADGGKPQQAPSPAGSNAPPAGGDRAGAAGTGGSGGNDSAPDMASSDALVRPSESECDYLELRARSDGMGAPFHVPTGEHMACFLIDAGFDSPTQALEFKALIEQPDLVTNIVLRTLESSEVRGPVISCAEGNSTHKMVAVWAPGMDDWYYPADVGVELGRGLFYLEVLYNNRSGAEAEDRSGMRVCTTQKVRPRTASMSWLGNQVFLIPGGARDYPVSGRCTPRAQVDPIRLLRVAPYMHARGVRSVMQIDRIDGSTQLLLDEPFVPTQNKAYDIPATVRAGDTILSRCYYDNHSASSVGVGVLSDSELCHFFVLATPAYSLVSASTINIENNSCLGSP